MPSSRAFSFLVPFLLVLAVAPAARADKLMDLVTVQGARDNQLLGYGIVTGLNGTGDDVTVPYAEQSLRALLRRLGVQIDARQVRLRNVAAVVVTATIPPFARSGTRIDVTVSSMGNARSLRGGVLLQTPLRGADRRTYAVAQGPLLIGGFQGRGRSGSSVQTNVLTTGRIAGGALVERMVPTKFAVKGAVVLSLQEPSFSTAQRIADAVDKELSAKVATPLDGGAVRVKVPRALAKRPVALLARLAEVEVEPEVRARVVVNERTGTIVAGGDVRLSAVAISQGGITISVRERQEVSQPGALAGGETRTVPDSEVETEEREPPALTYVPAATSLADVASALSTFGVTPRELASVLQALRAAGALRAQIVVQ